MSLGLMLFFFSMSHSPLQEPSSSSRSRKKEDYGNGSKNGFSCGRKRSLDEVSTYKNWAKQYDKTMPEEIMMLCNSDRYVVDFVKRKTTLVSFLHFVP